MTRSATRRVAFAAAALSLAACRTASPPSTHAAVEPAPQLAAQSEQTAMAQARADSVDRPYTKADIDFMTGMIAHHAQAILMAGWAPSHDASPTLRLLCQRIINAQQDEIRTMQGWLRDRGKTVPKPDPYGMMMTVNGHQEAMLMPGMLTGAQLKQLDAARGPAFDQLFLTDMIQHHEGAVGMVHDLYETRGAGEDELVFKLASDIQIDQTTEINRMQKMLFELTAAAPGQ